MIPMWGKLDPGLALMRDNMTITMRKPRAYGTRMACFLIQSVHTECLTLYHVSGDNYTFQTFLCKLLQHLEQYQMLVCFQFIDGQKSWFSSMTKSNLSCFDIFNNDLELKISNSSSDTKWLHRLVSDAFHHWTFHITPTFFLHSWKSYWTHSRKEIS